jgi:hypothetical protein
VSLVKRDSLWFGLSVVVLSLGVGTFLYVRSTHSFARTEAVIMSTDIGSPGGRVTEGSQRVLYRYTVHGTEYDGQEPARIWGASAASFRVGASIPIYFETDSPAVSYLLSPPRPWAIIGGALLFTTFGLVTIISGWPH